MKIISDIPPFRLYRNIYFVGSSRVSVHAIDTEEGIVLLDTGYPDMLDVILSGLEALSLDARRIVAIFHTHGHIDHFGCTIPLKALSGAKTYISHADAEIVNGSRPLSWAREIGLPEPEPFVPDVLIKDGDIFTFGKTHIRCVATPGHTEGVMSFFITADGDENVCAMHGGAGMNSLKKDFLTAYGLPLSLRDDFRAGLYRLAEERVDLTLGNHPHQNGTKEKRLRAVCGESVLDPTEWERFLKSLESKLDALLNAE